MSVVATPSCTIELAAVEDHGGNVRNSSATEESVAGIELAHQLDSRDRCTLTRPNSYTSLPLFPNGARLSWWEVTFSLAKAVIGPGALFMPHLFARLGLPLGTLLVLLSLVLTVISLHCLGVASSRTTCSDYLTLASALGGSRLQWITFGGTLLLMLAPIIVALHLTAIYVHRLLGLVMASSMVSERLLEGILAIGLFWPVTLIRDPQHLAHLSALGMLGMLYIMLLSVVDFILHLPEITFAWKGPMYTPLDWRLLGGAGATILFSFSCHFNLPTILLDLQRPTLKRVRRILAASTSLAAAFYLVIGICSSLTHGTVPDDVLLARPGNTFFLVGQLIMALVNVFSFPLQIFPLRASLHWFWGDGRAGGFEHSSLDEGEGRRVSHHLPTDSIESLGIIITSLLLSLAFTSSAKVFDIIGAICGGPVTLALPAIFYQKSLPGHGRWMCRFLILIGSVMSIYGMLATCL